MQLQLSTNLNYH